MPVNHLSAERLSKSFNERVLFQELTFGIEQGQKVALVGVNGCGKSTLLKILAGQETADGGQLSFQKDLQVAYLDQAPDFTGIRNISDAIFNSDQAEAQLLKQYHQLVHKTEPSEKEKQELQELLNQIEDLNAWDYEFRVKEILGKLGIHDLDAMVETGVPMGTVGYPEDIANGVLYLASAESRYVTGTELVIDGGLCA